MTPFEELLKELGAKMGSALKPDNNQSCVLDFGEGVFVQIDLSSAADQILIGTRLGALMAGVYREKMLKAAAIANGEHQHMKGTLAFSEKRQELVLFQYLSLPQLTAEALYKFLLAFTHHAFVWVDAFKQGDIPAPTLPQDIPKAGFMGLK